MSEQLDLDDAIAYFEDQADRQRGIPATPGTERADDAVAEARRFDRYARAIIALEAERDEWRSAAMQARRDLQDIEDETAAGNPPLLPGRRFAEWTSPANTMRMIDRLVEGA